MESRATYPAVAISVAKGAGSVRVADKIQEPSFRTMLTFIVVTLIYCMTEKKKEVFARK